MNNLTKFVFLLNFILLIACNRSSSSTHVSSSEDMAILKINKETAKESDIHKFKMRKDFSKFESILDDDREL
ncbi:MAG: hypothetical protein AB3N18_05530 [Allomuricauda sp.]